MKRKFVVGAAVTAAAVGVIGGAVAFAGASDDPGGVTGAEADQAIAAALAETGGGTANSVEREDDDGATWEVEVSLPDGTTVDVRLDAQYGVLSVEGDSDASEPPEPADDPATDDDDPNEVNGDDPPGTPEDADPPGEIDDADPDDTDDDADADEADADDGTDTDDTSAG